jgi:CDP-diacylglycerol--glycerol-3-phosphate 3-phosphatidyltransferase
MIWTIPNILTIGRLAAAPLIALVFVVVERPIADNIAIALFLIAAITDYVDGWLARKLNQVSELGKMLDPIADKVMILVGLILVLGYLQALDPYSSMLLNLMFVPATLIATREVLISGVREYLGDVKLPVTLIAKWKTTVQLIAIGVGLCALRIDHDASSVWIQFVNQGSTGVLVSPQDAFFLWLGPVMLIATLLLLTLAAILTVISGLGYMRAALDHLRTPEVF